MNYRLLLLARLNELEPPMPFDLEPPFIDGKIYSISQFARANEIREQYAQRREWCAVREQLVTELRASAKGQQP